VSDDMEKGDVYFHGGRYMVDIGTGGVASGR
jgi:hypothetical protein